MSWLFCALILVALAICISTAKVLPNIAIHSHLIASTSTLTQKSRLKDSYAYLTFTLKRVFHGFTSIIPTGLKVMEIRKAYREDPKNISYMDWRKIQIFSEDLTKIIRLAITIPFSPELFFYSYIVAPMLSSTNPSAWISLPSSFDNAIDKAKRDQICIQRRFYALGNIVQILRKEIIDDMSEETRQKKIEELQIVVDALAAPTPSKGLKILTPWLYVEKRNKRSASDVTFSRVNGAIVKDFCRCIG